jgi:phosphinothricin acetyltransferase
MRLRLRSVDVTDSAQIAAIYAHFVTNTPVSFESVAPDSTEIARRIEESAPEFPWLVCDAGGTVAGYAYASRHRARFHYQWSVDVSVYVHDSYRRRGIGRALYAALLEILSLQGFVMAHAGITLPNEGSVALHESVGFRQIGIYRNIGFKLGSWHDVGWWQLQLGVPRAEPLPPLPHSSVKDSAAWLGALQSGQSLLEGGKG